MTGIIVSTPSLFRHIDQRLLFALAITIVVVLGVRTAIRGTNWSSYYTLAKNDVAASQGNYTGDNSMAVNDFDNGDFRQAEVYASKSVSTYPTADGYNTLGQALAVLGNYAGAAKAFSTGMKYQKIYPLYENMAALTAEYGSYSADKAFLMRAVTIFPQNPTIWMYLAILDYRNGDNADAKAAISQAYTYGQPNQTIATINYRITNNLPLDVTDNPNPEAQ